MDDEPISEIKDDILSFVGGLNHRDPYFQAARYVAGVCIGYFGGPEWGEGWAVKRGNALLEVDAIEVVSLGEDDAVARVTYHWSAPFFHSEPIEEVLKLLRVPALGDALQFWQILPPDQKLPIPSENQPVLNYAAGQIFDPSPAGPSPLTSQALSNLKHLGLAAMMFVQDFDSSFAFHPQYVEKALEEYLRDDSYWNVPGQNTRFGFNANLAGRKWVGRWEKQEETVLFYEGEAEKPTFRYDGKAAICFADGHVELRSSEEMEEVIWKP